MQFESLVYSFAVSMMTSSSLALSQDLNNEIHDKLSESLQYRSSNATRLGIAA